MSSTTFAHILLQWFEENGRKLPWRNETDPYKIWISEVILQQTRVVQGLSYYHRFLDRFPDVKTLAQAPETDVLRVWQGLGYYSRARNLHASAQTIMSEHHGIFPNNYEQIRKLKGIGDYTAAAIASFAFNLPYPAIDGNVLRFVSRYFGIFENIAQNATRNLICQKCLPLMPPEHAGTFNQAMMEMGAMQCVPLNPNCQNCPFASSCNAFQNRQVAQLPVKLQKIKIRNRYFHYLLFLKENQTVIQQRTAKDIWTNLYELPLIETATPDLILSDFLKEKQIVPIELPQLLWQTKHVLTHQRIFADFHVIVVSELPIFDKRQVIVNLENISQYPVAKITERFFEKESLLFGNSI